MLRTALRYWNTIRHLRPVQIYGRILFQLRRPQLKLGAPAPPRRAATGAWQRPAERRLSMVGPSTFCFLNETRALDSGWDATDVPKLWRYNLHYFDDLNAETADARASWHSALLERWIAENDESTGIGWDSYPTSLRIVNWIKWALRTNALSPAATKSLADHARWLAQRTEEHLLANHLFVNAKALVFAGLFFEGVEARTWLRKGARILRSQLQEQILDDGGQFELSTMYHALAYEDVLDLCNVLGTFSIPASAEAREIAAALRSRVAAMRVWLDTMCHPDGEISFFNDASFGIAPPVSALHAYASRLGFPEPPAEPQPILHLRDSGYIRLTAGPITAILDVARIGPDYQPGHAHADTLSFECSLHGQRVFVNGGTSTYEPGVKRLAERGTAAHNTVVVDHQDSSEVWGAFRVARRARPSNLEVFSGPTAVVRCSHDGYLRLNSRTVHTREWRLEPRQLVVVDQLSGKPRTARAYLHLHPAVRIVSTERSHNEAALRLQLRAGQLAILTVRGATTQAINSTWSPEFGATEATQTIVATFLGSTIETVLTWE